MSETEIQKRGLRLPPLNRDWLIYALSFLFDLCVGGVLFVVTRRLSDNYKAQGVSLATEALHLGLIGGAMFFTYTMGTLLSGRLSDRVGRRRLMVLGAAIFAVGSFLCGQTERIAPLSLLCMLLGVGGSIFWPPTIAWLGENKSGGSLRWAMGCFCVAWNLGILLGNSMAGRLYKWSPTGAIAVFASALAVGALAILWPSRAGTASSWARKLPEQDVTAAAKEARSHHFARAAWAANFVAIFGLNGVTALFPQLATALKIDPAIHGDLMSSIRYTAIAGFMAVQMTAFWRHRTWPLVLSQMTGMASVLIVAVGKTPTQFALAFLLMGLGAGFNYFASVYYSIEAYPHAKGKGSGFHEAVLGAGLFFGSMLSGAVGAWASTSGASFALRAPYWFCAAMFAVGALAQGILFFSGKIAAKPLRGPAT